jgi:hypothetical protein
MNAYFCGLDVHKDSVGALDVSAIDDNLDAKP